MGFASCCLLTSSCDRCKRDNKEPEAFSDDNDTDPGDVPPQLPGLTQVEEMLIARACATMRVYRLKGGQRGFEGHVVNVSQDAKTVRHQPQYHLCFLPSTNNAQCLLYLWSWASRDRFKGGTRDVEHRHGICILRRSEEVENER